MKWHVIRGVRDVPLLSWRRGRGLSRGLHLPLYAYGLDIYDLRFLRPQCSRSRYRRMDPLEVDHWADDISLISYLLSSYK